MAKCRSLNNSKLHPERNHVLLTLMKMVLGTQGRQTQWQRIHSSILSQKPGLGQQPGAEGRVLEGITVGT